MTLFRRVLSFTSMIDNRCMILRTSKYIVAYNVDVQDMNLDMLLLSQFMLEILNGRCGACVELYTSGYKICCFVDRSHLGNALLVTPTVCTVCAVRVVFARLHNTDNSRDL